MVGGLVTVAIVQLVECVVPLPAAVVSRPSAQLMMKKVLLAGSSE